MKFNILVDPRDIGEIIAEFDSLKDFSVTFEAPCAPLVDGEAEKEASESIKIEYTISPDRKPKDVVESIQKLINAPGFKRGSAKGIPAEGELERTVNLVRVPHDFGAEDFDAYAALVDQLNDSNYQSNNIVSKLIEKIQSSEYSNVFGSP